MGCVFVWNRHSSGKSPVAHMTVRISSPSKQTPPLSGSCEGDDCAQRPPSLACWPWSTRGGQFGVRERHDTCFAAPLLSHGASRCSVPSTNPSCPRRLDTFCTGGMSSVARAPRDQGLYSSSFDNLRNLALPHPPQVVN